MTREEAWLILTEYTEGAALIKHALTVEAVMRAFARRRGEDEELWGITGLLHDFDYERYPTIPEHPREGVAILTKLGVPAEIRRAILGHATHTGIARDTPMAKTLFAVDELSGFVSAVALVRPGKSIHEVTPKSVLKKMKDKTFAAKVSRDDIRLGMEELGVKPEEHLAEVIEAMKPVARSIGLAGANAQAP